MRLKSVSKPAETKTYGGHPLVYLCCMFVFERSIKMAVAGLPCAALSGFLLSSWLILWCLCVRTLRRERRIHRRCAVRSRYSIRAETGFL